MLLYNSSSVRFNSKLNCRVFDNTRKKRLVFFNSVLILKLDITFARGGLDASIPPAKNQQIHIRLVDPLLYNLHLRLVTGSEQFHSRRDVTSGKNCFDGRLPFRNKVGEG